MRTRTLTDLVHFTEETPRTEVLFESRKLWSQVICLQGPQGVGPISDEDADGLLFVLSGEIAAQIGKARARLKQWGAAPIPAGDALTLRNASPEPAVVLLVLAPPPGH
jgi:glyoxylate utilization-related uncharacterized protein